MTKVTPPRGGRGRRKGSKKAFILERQVLTLLQSYTVNRPKPTGKKYSGGRGREHILAVRGCTGKKGR